MSQLNYQIKNNRFPRRNNWKDFVSKIDGKPQHKYAILTIHFNHFENTKRLLDYLQREKNQNFDIIFIENSTNIEEKTFLLTYATRFDNCIVITPLSNVGSAGGYALGMEYILSQSYEYFFVVEDDIILEQEQTFSSLMKEANAQTLTFINTCRNVWSSAYPSEKGKSWRVQLAGYPVSFVEKIGIIDPRNFFRAEDLERGERIEMGIQKYHYQVKIINHNYLHPYLKPVNGNYTRMYFSIRNQLFRLLKNSKGKLKFFGVLFCYVWTALDKWLIEGDNGMIKIFFSAIWDFLCNNFSFQHNQKKMQSFHLKPSLEGKRVEKSEFSELTKKFFSTDVFLFLTGIDKEKLTYSHKLSNFFTQGVLISANATIVYPLFILAPKRICINAFDLQTNKIQYIYMDNFSWFLTIWKYVSTLITALVSLVLMVIVMLAIGLRLLIKVRGK